MAFKVPEYEDQPVKKSKKQNIMVISEMSGWRIVGHLLRRYNTSLFQLAFVLETGYLGWVKVVHPLYAIFFS